MWWGRKKPILVEKNFKEDGELKSVLQYIDHKLRKNCLIPKWLLITAALILAFILISLIAAIAVVSLAKTPAAYQQSCEGRSCMTGMNLKCVNNTCSCDTGYFFINNCSLKKTYNDQCHLTSHCRDNVNLLCLDGVCKCDTHQYWNGFVCIANPTDPTSMYGKSCSNNKQCITDAELYCDTKLGICTCNNATRFWDGNTCFPKRTYNEPCANTTIQCLGSQYLICQNQKCLCNLTQYWDTNYLSCLNLLFENATCRSSVQCFSPMTCLSSGICQCSQYQYHNMSILACINQKRYNGTCSVDFNCRADKYLQCFNGLCQCLSSFPVWSNGFDACIVPRTYTDNCYVTTDCDSSLNLLCSSAASNCNCPNQLVSNKCDCLRILDQEYYWDGNKCTIAHSYGQSCINSSTNYMCQTITQNTYCQGVTNQCKCKANFYFDTTSHFCLAQILSSGISCTQIDSCRSDFGLSCQSNFCLCDTTKQFWSTNKCINYYSYTEGICLNDSDCNSGITGLICRKSGTSCSCPVTIANGYCDCPTTSTVEYFWDGKACISALDNAATCTSNYQCLTDLKQLTCISGKCGCANGYYNTGSNKCSICVAGWYYARGYCFKGFYCNTQCSAPGYTMGIAVNLTFPDDNKWLPYYTMANWNFYGTAASNTPTWLKEKKNSNPVTTDPYPDYCVNGAGIYTHGQICQYTLY